MAPVTLYGATLSWNVTTCVAPLEEAGDEYEIGTGEHLARNPFGQVPALQDGDLYIFESRAVCKYACHKSKPELLKVGDLKESAMVDVWVEVEAHQFTAALSPIHFECIIHPMLGGATDRKVVEDNLVIVKLNKALEVYEAERTKLKDLAGDYLSHADLNHVSTTLCLGVKAWWTGLLARPSIQKVASLMKPSS